jgi:hypothetical protein
MTDNNINNFETNNPYTDSQLPKQKSNRGIKIAITIVVIVFVVVPIIVAVGVFAVLGGLGSILIGEYEGTKEQQLSGKEAIVEYLNVEYGKQYEIKDYRLEQRKSAWSGKPVVYVADVVSGNDEFKVYVTVQENCELYTTDNYEEIIQELTNEFTNLTKLPLPKENLSFIESRIGIEDDVLPCKWKNLSEIVNDKEINVHISFIYQVDEELNPNNMDFSLFFEKYPEVEVNIVNMVDGYENKIDEQYLKGYDFVNLDNKNVIKDKINAKYYENNIDIQYEHYLHEVVADGKITLIYNNHVLANELFENEGDINDIHAYDEKEFKRIGDYYLLKTKVIYNGEGLEEDLYRIENTKEINIGKKKMKIIIEEKEISIVECQINKLLFDDEYLYLSNYSGRLYNIQTLNPLYNEQIRIERTTNDTQETIIGFYVPYENDTSKTSETSPVETGDVSFLKKSKKILKENYENLDISRVLWYNIYTKCRRYLI